MPSKHKTPAVHTIQHAKLIDRLAWLRWQRRMDEYTSVVDLLAWFTPPVRVEHYADEIAQRVTQLEAHAAKPMRLD